MRYKYIFRCQTGTNFYFILKQIYLVVCGCLTRCDGLQAIFVSEFDSL